MSLAHCRLATNSRAIDQAYHHANRFAIRRADRESPLDKSSATAVPGSKRYLESDLRRRLATVLPPWRAQASTDASDPDAPLSLSRIALQQQMRGSPPSILRMRVQLQSESNVLPTDDQKIRGRYGARAGECDDQPKHCEHRAEARKQDSGQHGNRIWHSPLILAGS